MLPEFPNLWDSRTLKAREHRQHLVFPAGVFYDRKSGEVRTSRINILFALAKRISDTYEATKKGHFENFDETSLYVGMTGSQSNFLMEDLKRLERYFGYSIDKY